MRILLAEDDPVSLQMLRLMLEKSGHELTCVSDGDEAWQVLQRPDAPPLAILDWMMPGIDGPDLCRRVRAMNRVSYTYMILLTARSAGGDLIEGLNSGADDFVAKPFRHDELHARIRTAARILDLQEQLLASNKELERRATHDGLTGVYNRTAIIEFLGKELTRSTRRGNYSVAAILLDIDFFKRINDGFGHQVGDTVLCEVTRRIMDGLRPYDVLGRYGGEEFLVVLSDCDVDQGLTVAERIRLSCGSTPIVVGPHSLWVTVSLGVAVADSTETSVDELIFRADMVLYKAKAEGRNQAKVWEADKA